MPPAPFSLPKSLFALVTSGVLFWGSFVHATESSTNQTITLDKPAYFSTTAGDYIQLQPGNYELAAAPDHLQVIPAEETSARELSIEILIHTQQLIDPIAVSLSGKPDSESSDRHILALSLPSGFMYMAEGTYSGIRPRAVAPQEVISDPEQIYLEKVVHFFDSEGQAQVAKSGRYKVEQADQQIRLIPGEGQEAILLEAEAETHEGGGFNMPIALSLPGAGEEEADNHYVVLLLPDGKSLEAIGTYSGIQPRGVFDKVGNKIKKGVKKATKPARKTVNRAKNTVRRVGRRVTKSPPNFQTIKSTGRIVGNAAKNQARDTAKFGKQAAMDAKKRAEWAAKQAVKGAKWLGQQACKVGLKTAEVAVKTAGKTLSPALKQVQNLMKRGDMQRRFQQIVNQVKRQLGSSIVKAIKAGSTVMDPKNARVLKTLLKKETMCEKSPSEIQKTLVKMLNKPLKQVVAAYRGGNQSQVRTRGAKPFAVAMGIGGGGGTFGGVDVGARYTTSRFDNTSKPDQWFLDGNLAAATRAGGEGGIILGFFPNIAPQDTGGSFFAIAVGLEAFAGYVNPAETVSKGVGISIDFIMGPLTDKFTFQGFAISFTAGASRKSTPVGGGAVKVGYGVGL